MMNTRMILSTAAVIASAATAPAAVIDISGGLTSVLDSVVGSGNSARLIGDTTTYWPGNTSVSDIDLNGFEFHLNTGNGNAQRYNGAITGPGTLRITGRFDATWQPDGGLGGSTANSPDSVIITQGRATLGKDAGVDALAGPITVAVASSGNGAAIELENDEQINNASTIDTTSSVGSFNMFLGGFSETIAGMSMNATHIIDTGLGGSLTLGSLSVDGTSYGPGTYNSGNSSFVLGSGSVTVVPEPTVAVLGLLGSLALLRSRRS